MNSQGVHFLRIEHCEPNTAFFTLSPLKRWINARPAAPSYDRNAK
jgi:hypothetical protein